MLGIRLLDIGTFAFEHLRKTVPRGEQSTGHLDVHIVAA
jgi:hypothetical protein